MDHFFARLREAGKDARALSHVKICAIGSATADVLDAYGIIADVVPDRYQAEGIIDALADDIKPCDEVLIPRAKEAREVLPEKLREMGAEVTVAIAYETVQANVDPEPLKQQLKEGDYDFVTFTSSSTVTNLLKIIKNPDLLSSASLAAIGPITAETMKKNGLNPAIIAEEYTIKGLVEAIKEAL